MARIRTYALDDNVTGSDYWIGTDGNNNSNTKNFSPNSVAKYLNENEVVDVSNSIRFRYDTIDSGKPRKEGTLSFQNEIGATVPMQNLSSFILSKKTQSGKDVSFFLNILPTTKIILHKSDDINLFGLYKILSVGINVLEPNFLNVSLEFLSGHGSIEEDKDYIISLIDIDRVIPVPQLTKETFNYTSSNSFVLQNTIINVLQVIINATSLHPEGYSYTLPKTVTVLNELYSGDVITIVYNYLEEFLDVPDLQRVTNVDNRTTNNIILNNTVGENGNYTTINTITDSGTFQSAISPTNIDYQSVYSGSEMSINEIHSVTESKEMIIAEGNVQTSYTNTGKYNAATISAGNNSNNPSINLERNDLIGTLKIDNITSDIVLQYPNKTAGSYTIATTADIVPSSVYNITISSTSSITTETLGAYGGTNYNQNGRNVMINNSTTAITVAATISNTAVDFIASYTKLGTANITFTFTGTGAILVAPNGAILNGAEGSTALLTRSGSKVYLLINNI